MHVLKPTKLYSVWLAINGQKIICAQDQSHAISSFIQHYGIQPVVVINGLYAEKPNGKIDAGGGSLGQG